MDFYMRAVCTSAYRLFLLNTKQMFRPNDLNYSAALQLRLWLLLHCIAYNSRLGQAKAVPWYVRPVTSAKNVFTVPPSRKKTYVLSREKLHLPSRPVVETNLVDFFRPVPSWNLPNWNLPSRPFENLYTHCPVPSCFDNLFGSHVTVPSRPVIILFHAKQVKQSPFSPVSIITYHLEKIITFRFFVELEFQLPQNCVSRRVSRPIKSKFEPQVYFFYRGTWPLGTSDRNETPSKMVGFTRTIIRGYLTT